MDLLVILWPWLILSTIVCLSLAYLKLKYNTPEYKIHASLLVKDEKSGADVPDIGALEGMGLFGKSNVDNEVEIFKSRALMQTVVEENDLFIKYYIPGKISAATELYQNCPVKLEYADRIGAPTGRLNKCEIQFNIQDSSKYTLISNEVNYQGKYGDTIKTAGAEVVVLKGPGFRKWNNQAVTVITLPFDNAVSEYMARLNVLIPNKQASILYLTMVEAIPQKGEMVLNSLINNYLRASVNDKKQIADSTITFIDDRIKLVFAELSGIEKQIEGFKVTHKLTDVSEQAKSLLANTTEYAKQLAEKEIDLSVIDALEQFMRNNQNNTRTVPSSLVMQEPSFIALVQSYNQLLLQRDKMLMSIKPEHPTILTFNEQLKNLRTELLSSINSVRNGIRVAITELRKRTTVFDTQISKVPVKERIWLDFSRQQAIKQELYLFLLKKREETAISKSSTLSNARIIDYAKSEAGPFKPQRRSFLLMGLLLGLIIPFAVYLVKELFNNRVSSIEDITKQSVAPILAEIGHNEEESDVVVTLASRSLISEQFRSLRTSIKFLLTGPGDKVILITSSMSGEGKSFLSINLASALALAGKKVILMELDLRKPKISDSLKLNKAGITNFLVESDMDWRKWVQSFGKEAKFDILSSGPLPPNPAELLMLPKLGALLSDLRKDYDFIIMDSAPVGLVTDAQILASSADATLYVVRYGLTFKQQIGLIDKLYRKGALPRLNIVVNDVSGRKVGYGYEGYGYGYGFYGENKNKA